MRVFMTIIRAYNPETDEVEIYRGENIAALSWAHAEAICQETGRGYLEIDSILYMEVPCKPGTYEPDWENAVRFNNGLN